MAAVTRLGDITTGHDGFPPRPSITSSPDVKAEGIGVVRQGDSYAIHCNSTPTCHGGILSQGSKTVTANGKSIGRVGDPVNCGDTVAQGASSVFVGDATSAPELLPFRKFLAVAHVGSPFATVFGYREEVDFVKLESPEQPPTGFGVEIKFTGDGKLLLVGHAIPPFLTVYERKKDVFDPATTVTGFPTGQVNSIAFRGDGRMVFVGHNTYPYITIYTKNKLVLNKVDLIDKPPPGNVNGIAVSSDGYYIAVAHEKAPFVTMYLFDGERYVMMQRPEVLPSGTGNSVAMTGDGVYVVVAHEGKNCFTSYRRKGRIYEAMKPPTTPVVGSGKFAGFTVDGSLLVGYNTPPFVSSFSLGKEGFVGSNVLSGTPAGQVNGVGFTADGEWMAMAHNMPPFVTLYKVGDGGYTMLPSPTLEIAGNANAVAFRPGR